MVPLAAAKLPLGAPSSDAPVARTESSRLQNIVKAMLFGLITTIVVTPVMIGFAAIIFRHHAFHADPAVYAQLVKLVVFSSAVHQTAFTTCSSLPFAIGQVQDAGLIFLSKIASEIDGAGSFPEPFVAQVITSILGDCASNGSGNDPAPREKATQ